MGGDLGGITLNGGDAMRQGPALGFCKAIEHLKKISGTIISFFGKYSDRFSKILKNV
jgi:hypothetical protein